jgi:hypothetical protein
MFVFLSGSINYDNLMILVSLITVELTLRLWSKFSIKFFVFYLLTVAAGCFIKISFLPIAIATIVLLLIKLRYKAVKSLPQQFHDFISSTSKWLLLLYTLLFFIFATLFVQHYMVNAIRYHAVTPACNLINTVEQCREDFIYTRSEIFENGLITKPTVSTFQYVTTWTDIMRQRTIGILGSKTIDNTTFVSSWSQVMILLGFGVIAAGLSKKDTRILLMVGLCLFYTLCLFLTNRGTYHKTGVIDLAVQGRYLFPVLPLLILVVNHYIFARWRPSLASLYTLVTLTVFIFAGLPSYLAFSNGDWYTAKTAPINNHLHAGFNKIL